MKNSLDSGELLHDVLATDVAPAAAATSLGAVLGAVRRRRRWHRARSASVAGALVLAPFLLVLAWWNRSLPDREPAGVAGPGPATVARVETVALTPGQRVTTASSSSALARVVNLVRVPVVESDPRFGERIDDGGLLRMLAGRGAVLIDRPGGSRGLYLAGPGAPGQVGERVP